MNEMLLEVENLTAEERETATLMIEKSLGDQGFIVLLSLTGSRAYGWGGKKYDRDIHGFILPYDTYWDNCHIGRRGYDISVMTLDNLFWSMTGRWVIYEDLSNPIYIHEKLNHDEFMSFCNAEHVRGQLHTIQMELNAGRTTKQIRKLLHCYRQLMIPVYFLETGRVEINVLKINEELEMVEFPHLCDMYRVRRFKDFSWDSVSSELDLLEKRLNSLLKEEYEPLDREALEEWQEETRQALSY